MRSALTLLILSFSCAALFPQSGGSAQAESLYHKGRNAMAEEDWYPAAESFLAALKEHPAHAGAALSLSECYYELAEYDQALAWAQKARALARLSPAAANMEAFVLIALGRLTEAAAVIGGVLKQEPYNREALFAAGELDIARGRAGDAVRRYREGTRLYPRDRRLLLSLALALGSLGDTAASREYAERAKEAYPDDYRVFYYASYLEARAGLLREAIDDAETALYLRPLYAPARSLLAALRYRNGNYNEALALTNEAIAGRREDTGAWFLRGMAQSRLGRGAEARRSFETALDVDASGEWARAALEESLIAEVDLEDPQRRRWAAWHFEKARQYRQRNLYDDAVFEYRRGLRLDPYAAQRSDYAAILLLQGFRQQYLAQMRFIQNETGKANQAVNDAIETYTAQLATSFAARHPVEDAEIGPRWKVAVFAYDGQSSFYHADAGPLAAAYIKDILTHSRQVSALDAPVTQNGFAAAFRTAREQKADYFIIINVRESERDLSIQAEMYVARTGAKAAVFDTFRAGNDRLRGACRSIAEQLAAALPFRAVLLRREAGSGVIDKGRLDNLAPDAVFTVVKAGKADVKSEGIGLQYQAGDIVGEFTVKDVDEAIAGGALSRAGFFDLISAGDDILAKESAPPPAAAPPPPAQDPELRALLRSLR